MSISILRAILTSAHTDLIVPKGIPRTAVRPDKKLGTSALSFLHMNIIIPRAMITSAKKKLINPKQFPGSAVRPDQQTRHFGVRLPPYEHQYSAGNDHICA